MIYLKQVLLLIFTSTSLLVFAEETEQIPYKRQDNAHVQEIFHHWDNDKGDWLYKSIGSIVMQEAAPERPDGLNKTTFELVSEFTNVRVNRVLRAARAALEEEKEQARRDQEEYFWEKWISVLESVNCDMTQGRSYGDPHMQTFDGERYDFQTAGEYKLVNSHRNNFQIQTRQVRHTDKISVNAAAIIDVNGDLVSLYAQDFPDEFTNKMIRVNGEVVENDKDPLALKNGGVIRYQNGRHVIFSPTGEQVHARTRTFQRSALLDLDIFIPACGNDVEGLLGNADGDPSTDIVVGDRNLDNLMVDRSDSAVFGSGRKEDDKKIAEYERLNFIAKDFGDQFIVTDSLSLFEIPMGEITAEERYPVNHLTLSELTDEEVEEGKKTCLEAGVEEADLMACVYDYGYVGLAPSLPVTLIEPRDAPEQEFKDPNNNNENNNNNNNNNNDRSVTRTILRGIGFGTINTTPRPTPTKRTPTPDRR